jgi:glycosyltransferase involved in cell wall biosynthesis
VEQSLSTRPLRILHILEATGGGTKRHLLDLVQGMDRELITHVVACPRQRHAHSRHETILPELTKSGIPYYVIDMRRAIHPWYDLKALLQLLLLLRRERFDLIHVHSSKAGFLGRLAALLLRRRPVIYTPHGLYFLGQKGWRYHFYRLLEQTAGYFTDRVIAVSASEKAALIDARIFSPQRVVLIENGIDVKKYIPPVDRWSVRQQLCLPEKGPVVGTVSRFVPQKNPEMIFEITRYLIHTIPNIHFIWCGEGELLSYYQKRASLEHLLPQLHMPGFSVDVRKVLASLDIFIAASSFEGLPYSVLEAMACALPVVATNSGGLRDIIRHEQTGLLLQTDSPSEFGAAISDLLADSERRHILGSAGRRLIMQHFTVQESLRQTQQLYIDLIRR